MPLLLSCPLTQAPKFCFDCNPPPWSLRGDESSNVYNLFPTIYGLIVFSTLKSLITCSMTTKLQQQQLPLEVLYLEFEQFNGIISHHFKTFGAKSATQSVDINCYISRERR